MISKYMPKDFFEKLGKMHPEDQWIEMMCWCERCGLSLDGPVGGLCVDCSRLTLKNYEERLNRKEQRNLPVFLIESKALKHNNLLFKTELNMNDTGV